MFKQKYCHFFNNKLHIKQLQDNKVTGRKADVLQAAYLASEVAQRLVKAGNEVSFWFGN